jgi:hypothetical protein
LPEAELGELRDRFKLLSVKQRGRLYKPPVKSD